MRGVCISVELGKEGFLGVFFNKHLWITLKNWAESLIGLKIFPARSYSIHEASCLSQHETISRVIFLRCLAVRPYDYQMKPRPTKWQAVHTPFAAGIVQIKSGSAMASCVDRIYKVSVPRAMQVILYKLLSGASNETCLRNILSIALSSGERLNEGGIQYVAAPTCRTLSHRCEAARSLLQLCLLVGSHISSLAELFLSLQYRWFDSMSSLKILYMFFLIHSRGHEPLIVLILRAKPYFLGGCCDWVILIF